MGAWLIGVALVAVGFLLVVAAFTGFRSGDVLGQIGKVKDAAVKG